MEWLYLIGSFCIGTYITYTQLKIKAIEKEHRQDMGHVNTIMAGTQKIDEATATILGNIKIKLEEMSLRLASMEQKVSSFPSIDEIAKEVMSTKVPLNTLPSEVQENIKNMYDSLGIPMEEEEEDNGKTQRKKTKGKKKEPGSYIG